MKMLLLLLVAVMAISAPAFAAQWLTNGDFQTGTAITGTLTDANSAPMSSYLPSGWS